MATTTYAGCDYQHLRDLMAEREGIELSRASVRRIRLPAGTRYAFEDWLQAALQLLQTKPLTGIVDLDVTVTSNGWETRSVIKPDFVRLVISNQDELTSLPEVDNVVHLISTTPALASVLLVDAVGTPIQSEASYKWWLYTVLFSKFLIEYFRHSETVAFVSIVFEHIYNQLE